MKKSIIKSIALGIGGLLSLSFLFGAGLSNQFISKEENNNINQFNIRKYINTEGTKLPSSGGSLASGTYYLDSDLTLTNYITCATGKNIIINLNGFSLSAKPNSKQTIVYVKGGTLTINGKNDESGTMGTLCNGTGYYDGSYTRGGAIAMYADGTNVSNVTINDCNIGNNTAAFAGAIFISKGSTATLNNCNVYNNDSTSDPSYGYRGAIYAEDVGSTVNINGGEIYGNEGGVLLWGNNTQSSSANLNGVYVHDNAKFGVRLHGSANGNAPLTIAGDTIIKNNPSASSTEQANLRLNGSNRGKFTFPSGLGENAYIGITMQGTYGVFTSGWSQYMGDADFSDYFFSDSTAVIIGKNPSGELLLGAPRTVTYNTEHGTTPDADTVANGSIILNEPTSPSETGYAFQGWYKESTFENAWNFATDTVTADTTLYAKWEIDQAVASVTSGETVTKYLNISDAVSAWNSAASGATLTLLKDVTISSTINVSTTKTFDLNGYGLNASGISSSTDYAIIVNNGGNLTLNDSGDTIHYFTHEKYKDYDAGLATICDEDTYNAASEDSRGTFEGGYLSGLSIVKGEVSQAAFFKIEENSSVTMNGGTIIGIYADYSSSCVCSNGTFIMNGGNMIYNVNARGCINARSGILTINGGNISHNIDKSSKNTGRTAALWLNNINNPTYTIRGGTITNNVAVYGAINTQSDIAIEGNPVIKDNIGVGIDENSDAPMNIVLSMGIESKLNFIGEYTGSEPLGVSIYMDNVIDVTNSVDVSFNNKNNVVSDNPNYGIGMYPSNHAKAGQLFYKGVATINVIDAIDNIDPMSYDGGKNDSLNDIVDAINSYNNLPQNEQGFVDGINKDVLDHDLLTYQHVDNVGDLIKEIPDPSDSQEYYDAVDAAYAAYYALTDEEETLLNTDLNFQYKKTLDDNVEAKEVIEIIKGIGDVTYNGGQDDSKDDIITAQQAYDNLTNEQKELVDQANKDDLDNAKETYENVDDAVHAIESIGDINHGGENDSKDKINAARNTYDQLTNEQKDLVKNYQETYKDLNDAEKVYTVLEKIDDIDEGDDEKIKAAQDAYETLTPEQKELVKDEYVQKLNLAIKRSEGTNKQANILFIIFLILFIILIVSGLIVLYVLLKRRNEESDNNNKQVKLASASGLLPFAIFASYFTSTNFIILYVLAAIAILIWLTNLILFVSKKRQKEAKVEAKPEAVATNKPQTELVNEDDEVETIQDEKGNIFQIRFIKSFRAKLIQSPDETKKYYEELKNEVLSYKKTNSRVSWHYDAINAGRNYVLKFAVRGKTLCVYLPLNADDYTNSKYKVEKVESKKYEDVPCLYRIKNDRRLGYAKELIALVASNLGLEKGEECHEVYSDLPYEANKPLVARGLIKELKVQVHKPVEPQVLETKVSSDGDEVVLTKDSSGNIFEIRYIKSFTAKLSQSEDVVKDYYTILKNYALSYKRANSRVSWHYDAINVGRDYVLKFAVRGKTLCIYFALNADDYNESKYKVEKVESKRYQDTSCLYRIKNDRRCEYAKDLIDEVMKKVDALKGKEQNEDYHLPKESTKALLANGLIKELKSKVQDKKVIEKYESISASKADEVMSDEKAEASIEEVIVNKHKEGTKEIINIDTLSEHYNNNDEVTLESLIEKKLVPIKTGHIKVLARGVLDKTLHVVANEYSLQAVKMIVLVGGSVKKVK